MAKVGTCPRCKAKNMKLDALSRKDNKTMICSPCGTDEALKEMFKHMK